MKELTLIEIIKYAISGLANSEVLALAGFIILIILICLVFSKLMNKRIVTKTCTVACFVTVILYLINYLNTVKIMLDNISNGIVELIYFPSTLQFVTVMITSFAICIYTWIKNKGNKLIKIINTALPLTISFLFLCIIEYININKIPFDEFSVFENPILMSLSELAMGIFVSWVFGLFVYKVDLFVIGTANKPKRNYSHKYTSVKLPSIEEINKEYEAIEVEEEIEMPKLKGQI